MGSVGGGGCLLKILGELIFEKESGPTVTNFSCRLSGRDLACVFISSEVVSL